MTFDEFCDEWEFTKTERAAMAQFFGERRRIAVAKALETQPKPEAAAQPALVPKCVIELVERERQRAIDDGEAEEQGMWHQVLDELMATYDDEIEGWITAEVARDRLATLTAQAELPAPAQDQEKG